MPLPLRPCPPLCARSLQFRGSTESLSDEGVRQLTALTQLTHLAIMPLGLFVTRAGLHALRALPALHHLSIGLQLSGQVHTHTTHRALQPTTRARKQYEKQNKTTHYIVIFLCCDPLKPLLLLLLGTILSALPPSPPSTLPPGSDSTCLPTHAPPHQVVMLHGFTPQLNTTHPSR